MKEEDKVEWRHEYDTALGMMCGSKPPTKEQIAMAKKRADDHLSDLES